MADSNDLVFSASIDMSGVQKSLTEGLAQDISIPMDLDYSKVLDGVRVLREQFVSLQKDIAANEQVLTAMDDSVAIAAKSLADAVPNAQKLAKALKDADPQALGQLDELEERLKGLAAQAGTTVNATLSKVLSSPELQRYLNTIEEGMAAGRGQQLVSARLQRPDLDVETRRDVIAQATELKLETERLNAEAKEARQSLVALFGDAKDEAKAFVSVLNKDLKEGMSALDVMGKLAAEFAPKFASANIGKTALASVEQISAIRRSVLEARTEAQKQIKQAPTFPEGQQPTLPGTALGAVTVEVDKGALLASIRKALTELNAPVGEVTITADPESLVTSVKQALATAASTTFLVNVGANPDFLLDSIRSALLLAKDLKISVGAAITEQAAAAKQEPVKAGEKGVRASGDGLANRAALRQLRGDAVNDPLAVARKINDDLARRLTTVLEARGSGNQQQLNEAVGSRQSIVDSLNKAAANPKLARSLRIQAESLAITLDRTLFNPLRKELSRVGIQARESAERLAREKAAADRQYESDFKKLLREEEAERRRLQGEERKAQQKALRAEDGRLEQVRQQSRRIAENVMEGPKSRSLVQFYAPQAVADFDTLRAASATVKSPDQKISTKDRMAALELGRAAAVRINDAFEVLIAESMGEARQSALKAIQRKIGSQYITPIRNNTSVERTMNADAVWQQVAAQMTREIQQFGAARFDFGNVGAVPQEKLTLKALKDYQNQVLAFEKMNARFALARTSQEKDDQLELLDIARKKLQLAEDELKLRALEGRGTIRAPEVTAGAAGVTFGASRTMEKSEAYFRVTEGLSRALEKEFAEVQQVFTKAGREITQQGFRDSLFRGDQNVGAAFLRSRGVSEEILKNNRLLTEELEKQLAPMREAYAIQSKLTNEIKEEVAAAEALNQKQKQQAARGAGGAGFGRSIRNAAALFGGFGIGYTAAFQIQDSIRQLREFESEIAGIQGVLSGRNASDAQRLAVGVQDAAVRYGQNLVDAAKSARVFAQAGFTADQVVKQLNTSFAAVKAIGLPIDQVQELQIAVTAVTQGNESFNQSLDYTALVLEKISGVESAFAVSGKDLADGLQILSPILETFAGDLAGTADVFDITNALITTSVQRLRISGTQAANALKFIFSRLTRPEIGEQLQNDFGLKLGDETGKGLLPLNQLIPVIAKRYRELQGESEVKAAQFANLISGGRQSNILLTILQDQDTYYKAINRSSESYNGLQERAAIANETLATAVGKVNASFDRFIVNLSDTSGVGQGTIVLLNGLAEGLNSLSQLGSAGGTIGAVSGILALGGALQLARKAYLGLANAAKVAATTTAVAEATTLAARGTNALVSAGGLLARLFTPGGVLLAGLTAGVAIIGMLSSSTEDAVENYKIQLKTLDQLKANESPAATRIRDLAVARSDLPKGQFNLGLQSQQEAENLLLRFAGSEEAGKILDQLSVRVRSFDDASDSAFAKYAQEHPETFKTLTAEAVKAFEQQLPESARKSFSTIKSESEKVATLQALLGSAATLANLQIADSIDQIRQSTQRMIDDAIKGINDLQTRSSLLKILTPGDLNLPVGDRRGFAASQANRVAAINPLRDNEVFGPLVKSPAFKKVLEEVINGLILDRKSVTADEALAEALRRAAKDPRLANEYAFAANVGNPTAQLEALRRSQGSAPTTREPRPTEGLALGSAVTELAKTFEAANIAVAAREQSPEAKRAEEFSKLLQNALRNAEGNLLDLGDTAKDTVRGIRSFREALLNELIGAVQEISKFRTDERVSGQFGLGFDRIGAQEQLGRSLLGRAEQFETNNLLEILKLERQRQELLERREKLKGKKGSENQLAQVDLDLQTLQEGIQGFAKLPLDDVLPKNSKAAQKVLQDLIAEIQKYGVVVTSVKTLEERLGAALLTDAQGARRSYNDRTLALELSIDALQREGQLLEAQLPITATLAQRQQLRVAQAYQQFQLQQQLTKLQAEAAGQDKESLRVALEKLSLTYEMVQANEAQLEVANAQRALSEQTRQNLEGMVSGIRSLTTDTSIWEQLFTEEGMQERGKVVGRILLDTISPVFSTIATRMGDALQQKVVEQLLGIGKVAELAQLGEVRLKQDLQGATLYANAMRSAADYGAQVIGSRMENAVAALGAGMADGKGGMLVAGSTMLSATGQQKVLEAYSMMSTMLTAGGVRAPGQPGTGTLKGVGGLQLSKEFYAQAIGVLGGQMLGTIFGKAGPGAQKGANIGSTAGSLAAPALAKLLGIGAIGGPVGVAVTGLVGGLLGGFLGGRSDSSREREADQPLIQGLEAIARQQAETVQAIQNQTDALLRPESRLLNLPTTFSIPNYRPEGGGSRGGGGVTEINDNRRYEIRIDGGDLTKVRKVVEDVMASTINRQRRNQSW